MKTIGVITNKEKDKGLVYTKILIENILKRSGEVKLSSDVAVGVGMQDSGLNEEDVFEQSDIIICLGGDGTFLKAARQSHKKNKPMLGINLGKLGFLNEVDRNNIPDALDDIFSDNYVVADRMMLEACISRDGQRIAEDLALNDVVISRGPLSRILHVKTYVNDIFFDSFPGNGLIVSSPTGSTAYSLSAGGPIVEPGMDLLIITPICPHLLYSRSLITKDNKVVKVVIDESYIESAMVTADGQKGHEVRGGDIIEVKKSEKPLKMIRINPRDFYNVLRTKIYYRGEN